MKDQKESTERAGTSNGISPYFSRCGVGGTKWFWVTWQDFDAVVDRAVYSSGFASSALDAEEQARAFSEMGHRVRRTALKNCLPRER